jgi:HlyD family secretion protein
MHWRRDITIAVIVVAIVGAIIYGFMPTPQWVDAATVQRGPLSVTIDEEGKTRVIDRYVVSAPVAAYARRIDLEVGDAIQQGQALVQLEPLPSAVLDPRSRAAAQARVDAAKAALDSTREKASAAKAEAELAQLEHKRIVDMCKVQCASKEEQDVAMTKVRSTRALQQSAQFAVDIARHELEAARTALTYAGAKDSKEPLAVSSPINGSVLKIIRKSEGVVGAGEPLIEVGNPRHLEVEVDVLSADAVKIAPGTRVLFERWGGDEALEGRVRTIEPVGFTKISALGVEEQRVLVISDLTSPTDRWQRLGDGYRVEASFILWQQDDVLTIPTSSLFRHGDGWAVFVIDGDTARLTKVKLGHRNGLHAQVLAGLNQGQQVITHPGETIEDGVAVRIR